MGVTLDEATVSSGRRPNRKTRVIIAVAVLAVIIGVVGAVALASRSKPSTTSTTRCVPVDTGTLGGTAPASGATTPAVKTYTDYSDAVQAVGQSHYAGIYAGARINRGGSVTVFVGPGSDAALLADLRCIDPASLAESPSPGTLPALDVIRVPLSAVEVDRQAQAFEDASASLEAQGYAIVGVSPNTERGEVDVRFHAVPPGVTVATATSHLDATVAPNIVVTSIDARYPLAGGG